MEEVSNLSGCEGLDERFVCLLVSVNGGRGAHLASYKRVLDILGCPPEDLTREGWNEEYTVLRGWENELSHVLHEDFRVSELF